ncbi:DUF167 domain-containing protein [Chitinibacter sp. S2-10]|uniref:DUF167 domain-containing protein n=1 Tax=Chitinibacter sp. S2-10 TaxID=3373597 RepID=UPI0039777CA7
MSWYSVDGVQITLRLHIQPGAKKTECAGLYGEAMKIRLAAPPVDGKANQSLIVWLADFFKVPQRQVQIKSGETNRRKVVCISGSGVLPSTLNPN